MNKSERMMKFEQILNYIETSISIAENIELEEIKDDLELLLSNFETKYDDFVNR